MRKLAVFCLLFCFISLPCCGQQLLDTEALLDALPQQAAEHLGDITPETTDVEKNATQLLRSSVAQIRNSLKESVSVGFIILLLCALLSIATAFTKNAGLSMSDKVCDFTAVALILTVCLTASGSVLSECAAAVTQLDNFSSILLPIFAAATAISGKPASAVASSGATVVFSKLILSAAHQLLIPALYLYIIACAMGSLSDSPLLTKTAQLFRWLFTVGLRGLLIVFTAYLSIAGVLAGSADAVALKTAQVTISGVIPVVGSLVAGTSEAILNGGALLRSSIGIFGFLGTCAICLTPFVSAALHLLTFKILAAVSASFSGKAASVALDGIASAYSMALGLLGTCCAVQFIAIVVGMVVTNT